MRKLIYLITITVLLFINVLEVNAKDAGYNYSYWGDAIPSATGLSPAYSFNQFDLGIELTSPEDLFVNNNLVYMIDSGTNKLTILDDDYQVLHHVGSFNHIDDDNDVYTLSQPKGVTATEDAVYIADTQNSRILKLNHNLKVVDVYDAPDDRTFEEIDYRPLKLSVDRAGRTYVIAQGVYEGIIELNNDGTFNRYTGVNEITVNPLDIFWRQFLTEEQISKMQLYLPTEFTNLQINEMGFIYSTAKADKNGESESMIKALNPKGLDVLKRNGYSSPQGDLEYVLLDSSEVVAGPSNLVGITVNDYGVYTVLDQKRGRLFTYDNEGYLLYISGGKGTQVGKLQLPVAVQYKEEDLLVLDQSSKTLVVYKPTQFGELVNEAINHHYYGRFEESADVWQDVVKLNSNYEIAYIGIGKSLLRQEQYEKAMNNFELGKDKDYYSKAFVGYREELLERNFGYIASAVTVLIIVVFARGISKGYKDAKEE
ncbi:NHL repeat-containing protein [Haloplasma contractile]|uniref:NHL repeat containing protein n=1 Tax=Haloplasma contractile SSD-17B TaxID=1033810 RepID=F7PRD7_9MOLU|nr:hypothetical protein [Haloplasma contractile]ERJ11737.1 NHL repeat containing protein [Haloplasma contractile SSD-17B]